MSGTVYGPDFRAKVEIIEARDLLAADKNGLSDPYTVIEQPIGIEGRTDKPIKTPVIKKTLNPVWNYSVELPFTQFLPKISFCVFDHDFCATDDILGQCSVSVTLLNNGPVDVWLPLKQKHSEDKKPYPTKGELHVRITPIKACLFCDANVCYALQSCSLLTTRTEASLQMVPINAMSPTPDVPYQDVKIAFGYDCFSEDRKDLTTSLVVFGADGCPVDTVNYKPDSCCFGLIKWNAYHAFDTSGFYASSTDADIFTLNLQRLPPEVTRIAFVVNSSSSDLKKIYHCGFCVFSDNAYIASKSIRMRKITSPGFALCLFHRSWTGRWLFQTILQPISAHSVEESKASLTEILSLIPPM